MSCCPAITKKTGLPCNRRVTRFNKRDTLVCGFHGNTECVVPTEYCPEPCPICLEPIEVHKSHLTPCFHCFHDKCLYLWGKKTCPVCRGKLT